MDVQLGDRLTDLQLLDEDGRPASLADLREGDPAVLYLMRTATCPPCLHHARTLAGLRDQLAAHDVRPFVLVPGGTREAATVRRRVPGVRVLGTPDAAAHHELGLGRTLLLQHSGTFLLDHDGRIRLARTATMPHTGFDRRQLLEALARL